MILVKISFLLLDNYLNQMEGFISSVIYVVSDLAYSILSVLFVIYAFRVYTFVPKET